MAMLFDTPCLTVKSQFGLPKKERKTASVRNIQWNNDTGTNLEMYQTEVKHRQIQQPGVFERGKKNHSKPEEGWSPIQVTQPRDNLQVSFHQYINWSTVKVIQTKRCMYTLRILTNRKQV